MIRLQKLMSQQKRQVSYCRRCPMDSDMYDLFCVLGVSIEIQQLVNENRQLQEKGYYRQFGENVVLSIYCVLLNT